MRSGLRSLTAAIAACGLSILSFATAHPARAGNLGDFLEGIFGNGQQTAQPQAEPRPEDGTAAPRFRPRPSRPLTVKLRRPKVKLARTAPGTPDKQEPVTIFTDRTLRRGDAVMTSHGLRIFTAAGKAPPYTDDDFVAVSAASRLDKDMRKTLVSIDNVPRR